MLRSTLFLTVATLAGLIAGFGREWLLIADWGVGGKTDAFLVAMFLPEALRTMFSGGILSAALLPLWQAASIQSKARWLSGQVINWFAAGLALTMLIVLAATPLTKLIGPGLSSGDQREAIETLRWLAVCMPGLLLQAVLSVPLQATGRFLLSGLGSLLFNLPAVSYLWWLGKQADSVQVAQCFIAGSLLMSVILLPSAYAYGWRPWLVGNKAEFRAGWNKLWPLLLSSGASQGLALLERLVASLLGEGAITLINLARKLVNIPLIALMGLNQVLLGKMAGEDAESRLFIMQKGLSVCTWLTLPPVAILILVSPILVDKLLPTGLVNSPLPLLLSLFALSIVFGSWNALLARYFYAGSDTKTPLACELTGSTVQMLLLLIGPVFLGMWGMPVAVLGGVLTTGVLLSVKVSKSMWLRLGQFACFAVVVLAGCTFALLQSYYSDENLLSVGTLVNPLESLVEVLR